MRKAKMESLKIILENRLKKIHKKFLQYHLIGLFMLVLINLPNRVVVVHRNLKGASF